MDLITNTWTTSDLSPLFNTLSCVILVAVAIAINAFILSFGRTRRVKITTRAIALAATIAVAVAIPVAATQPRVPTSGNFHYIEAAGTIESITPNLNRGGTGIRLTNAIDVLLTVDDDTADTLAGLQGHPTTLYCNTPDTYDWDTSALAAGTILSCDTTKPHFTGSSFESEWLLQDTKATTRTPITTS